VDRDRFVDWGGPMFIPFLRGPFLGWEGFGTFSGQQRAAMSGGGVAGALLFIKLLKR